MPESLKGKIKIPGLPLVIAPLSVMMEVFWIYTWMVWASLVPDFHWNSTPLTLISCLLLGIWLAVIVRLALNSHWTLKKVRLVVIPAGFMFLFILIRFDLSRRYPLFDLRWFNHMGREIFPLVRASILGIVIIWRGIYSGQVEHSFASIYRRFLIGLVCLIILLAFWRVGNIPVSSIWNSLGSQILLFFGSGLLALALANLKQYQKAGASFNRRWISMLIIMVAAILLIGIILTALYSQETGAALVHFLAIPAGWLFTGFLYLLYPLGLLAQILLWAFEFIVALIRGDNPPPAVERNFGLSDLQKILPKSIKVVLPAALVEALKWGSVIVFAGLVIFSLSRLLKRYAKVKTEDGVEEVYETLGSWNLLKKDLLIFLAGLLQRLRRRKSFQIADNEQPRIPALKMEGDLQYTIREIYQALLREGRQKGTPRRSFETPYEYSRRLKEHRETMTEELDTITEAYILERYGRIDSPPEKISSLNRAWCVLRDKFRNTESEL